MFRELTWEVAALSVVLFTAAMAQGQTPVDSYQVVHSYPHDPEAFTQGLLYSDGHLYESTGRNGTSSIRILDLASGKVLQKQDLPGEYSGEGLTDWSSNLLQLTWKTEKGFIYDRFSFTLQGTFHYRGEGWGLTHDSKNLILSDGSSLLRFLNPHSYREIGRLSVTDERKPVKNLNELEYIRGEIYANVWGTDRIARISPQTGQVLRWIDLSGIMDNSQTNDPDAVLNGIAYDRKADRLFVTGKLWPRLFEIRVVNRSRGSKP
jgi:glutaminyl-peptide cyclotransferase